MADPVKNAVNTFLNLLTGWGIKITPEVRNFAQRAAQGEMSSAEFLAEVRGTKFYAKAFPGIMRKNGTMRMTEAQYIAGYQRALDVAHTLGRDLGRDAYGFALKNDNSPNEIVAKLKAVDSLKENRALLAEFGDYLVATGVAKRPPKREDLLNFVMKQGPAEWEQAWETATQAAAIQQFGITVGRDSDVSYKDLKKFQSGLLPDTQPDFAALAKAAATLGASRLYGMGITAKDLVELSYGGKNAPKIAERVKLALGTATAAATEERATPQLTLYGMNKATGPLRRQVTE